jgi:hypothetical protein
LQGNAAVGGNADDFNPRHFRQNVADDFTVSDGVVYYQNAQRWVAHIVTMARRGLQQGRLSVYRGNRIGTNGIADFGRHADVYRRT